MSSTEITVSPIERLIVELRKRDKRISNKLSNFGAAIYLELFRLAQEHPELRITKAAHFADYIQMHPLNFSRYLTNERIPEPDITEYICDQLQCSYDRKVTIMALIQQTPRQHRQLAEEKLNKELLHLVTSLERQPTTSTLSFALEMELPPLTEFSPLLEKVHLEDTKLLPNTEPSISSVQGKETRLLRGSTASSIQFPRRRGRSTTAEI